MIFDNLMVAYVLGPPCIYLYMYRVFLEVDNVSYTVYLSKNSSWCHIM